MRLVAESQRHLVAPLAQLASDGELRGQGPKRQAQGQGYAPMGAVTADNTYTGKTRTSCDAE